jgi:hypothetical protein
MPRRIRKILLIRLNVAVSDLKLREYPFEKSFSSPLSIAFIFNLI